MIFIGIIFSIMFSLILFSILEPSTANLGITRGIYHHDKAFDDLLPTTVTQWSPADSKVQCGRLCQTEKWCNSFFFNHGKTSCALQRMVYRQLSFNQTVTSIGWRYYHFTSKTCPTNYDSAIDRLTATCYRLLTSPKLTWLDARAACNSSNERLVVLEPVEKARFIQDFLNTNIVLHHYSKSFVIGASRPQPEWNTWLPNFVWLNGQPLDLNASQTVFGNTNDMHDPNKNVLCLKKSKGYLIGTCKDSIQRFYICERTVLLE